MIDAGRCPDDRCGLCGASRAASAAELDHWMASGESWRAAELRWQDWSAGLLAEFGLQPPHGRLGDESARAILGSIARAGWSRATDEAQPSAPRCPSARAALQCERLAGHEGPCRVVRRIEQVETWQAATKPPKGTP